MKPSNLSAVASLTAYAAAPATRQGATADVAGEQAIRAAGADRAPRVTADQVQAELDASTVLTHHFPGTSLVVAVITSRTGFVLGTGFAKPVSAENFKVEIGERFATEKAMTEAREKVWELEGYMLHRSEPGPRDV